MNAKAGLANLISGTRILCSAALLICPAFSASFYVLYLMAGLTDMIDGAVARMTGTTSEFGAKLDTAADFVFVAVCLWKLLPSLAVPLWLWIWIVLIALIKMINTISGYVIQKKVCRLTYGVEQGHGRSAVSFADDAAGRRAEIQRATCLHSCHTRRDSGRTFHPDRKREPGEMEMKEKVCTRQSWM